jgi:hypothetical protein
VRQHLENGEDATEQAMDSWRKDRCPSEAVNVSPRQTPLETMNEFRTAVARNVLRSGQGDREIRAASFIRAFGDALVPTAEWMIHHMQSRECHVGRSICTLSNQLGRLDDGQDRSLKMFNGSAAGAPSSRRRCSRTLARASTSTAVFCSKLCI